MGEIAYDGQKRPLVGGKTIFDYADELAVQVPTSCGRTGVCHECIVEVSRGHEALSAPTEAEEFLRGNYRLACQAAIENPDEDVRFSLLRSRPKILTGFAAEEHHARPDGRPRRRQCLPRRRGD